MKKNNHSNLKVAIVTESLWKMAGANRVLESISKIYPNADIFALFGDREKLSDSLNRHKIYFSFLNRFFLIKYYYRSTLLLWPIAIESFDFSEYDLVISNTSSVAHGVVTPLNCKHIAYVNSPMRYAWDLSTLYFDVKGFGTVKRATVNTLLSFCRVWDTAAAQRADILIANSNFIKERIEKYWDRQVTKVIYPPVQIYNGKIKQKRGNYFVSGAPYEPNKRGDFLLKCACELGFNLKLIGGGSMKRRLKRKYRKYKNIQFLDWISEEEKWELISSAKGFIVAGIEDYGIFCAEAISAGTPVLAYNGGGSKEIVRENISGMFFKEWTVGEFDRVYNSFVKKEWDYQVIKNSQNNINLEKDFKREIEKAIVE